MIGTSFELRQNAVVGDASVADIGQDALVEEVVDIH